MKNFIFYKLREKRIDKKTYFFYNKLSCQDSSVGRAVD